MAEIKKPPDPNKDFLFSRGVPYFIPSKAAILSDIIKMSHEVMARPFENNRQLIKSPTAI